MTLDGDRTDDVTRWRSLMALFDELSELPAARRDRRLADLRADDPALVDRLAAMLACDQAGCGPLDNSLEQLAPDLHLALKADANQPDEIVGRYRLLERIGSGGMGDVWLAERADGEYQQRVALKLLKRGMDTDTVLRRFRQERSILARLAHPNIVRLLDGGVSADGRPYYVMEHVAGRSITDHARERALAVRQRIALIVAVADAVAHAHAQLIVHRDLKPANVLVDANGVPHLLDFGIAKLLEETGELTLTRTDMRLLSPAYASPEQIRGEPIGTATDVYALGLLLFELLTGTLPHRRQSHDLGVLASGLSTESGDTASQALARTGNVRDLYGPHVEARQIVRELAGDLDVIVAKALKPESGRRYLTVAALADDLRNWLDGRAIAARPDSHGYRLGKFVRRHKIGVFATVTVVAALLSGLGVALWQAGVATEQARVAEQQARRSDLVKGFLIDLFRQNDPARSHGESLTGEQMLERSQAALDARFGDDPDTHGELLVAIAEIRHALTDFDEALANVDRGIALLAGSARAGDPRLAHAHFVRSQIYRKTDRHGEAEAELRRARAILLHDAETHAEQIDTIDEALAAALRYTGHPRDAAPLQQAVVARSLARHGPDSAIVAERRAMLAVFLEDAGEYAQAEAEYRLSLPVLEDARTQADPFLARAQMTFAGLLDRVGKQQESAVYFDRAIAAQAQLFGTDSPDYARAVFSRGILMLNLRQYPQAEQDFRTALSIEGDASMAAGHCARYLGLAMLEQDRPKEAMHAFQQAERIYRQVDLPNDMQRWRARADYGEALLRTGDLAGADIAVRTAIEGISQIVGDDDIHLSRALDTLGRIARDAGDPTTALGHHRRWLAIIEARLGLQAPEVSRAKQQIIRDLLARGTDADLDQADTLSESLLETARSVHPSQLAIYETLRAEVKAALTDRPVARTTR